MKNWSEAWKQFPGKAPSTVRLDPDFYRRVPKGSRVLDFGCARGRLSAELHRRGYRVAGVDICLREVRSAAQDFTAGGHQADIPPPLLVAGDGRALPLRNGTFDCCLMQAFMTTIGSVAERRQVLREAARVLVRKGTLYLGVFARTDESPLYARRYAAGYAETCEWGSFSVPVTGQKHYRAHHYSEDELRTLLSGLFRTDLFKQTVFTSYHGNHVNAFVIFARKV